MRITIPLQAGASLSHFSHTCTFSLFFVGLREEYSAFPLLSSQWIKSSLGDRVRADHHSPAVVTPGQDYDIWESSKATEWR
jgi:hypothetical protein